MASPVSAAPRAGAVYLAAALLGILFFFLIYSDPFAFLVGEGSYFEVGDAPQHVSGWLLYAKDAWRWPLLTTQLFAPPQGTHIALTDSIPLAALVFKPLFPLLGENFHYFGLWHLFTKILQATGAVYLLRSLGQRGWVAGLAGAALALMWPSMLFRLQHTALMTHGVLLYALGFYFRTVREQWGVRRTTGHFAGLSLASLLIHPYLFAMVFPIFGAACLDRWGPSRDWRSLWSALIACSAAVGLPALALGYASAGGGGGGGFEIYSMNLLSPICGGSLGPCGFQDATGGQYEGFNTFGLGALALIGLALGIHFFNRGSSARSSARPMALIAVLIALTLYALSGHIYLGQWQLTALSLPYPMDRLTMIFRASGRFFWPVSYAVVFIAFAVAMRRPRLMAIALPLILLVQWADTAGLRAGTAAALTAPAPFDYTGWTTLADRIDRIEIVPEFGCEPAIENMKYMYFQIVAGRLGVPINTGYQARSSALCEKSDETVPQTGTLLVDLRPVAQEPSAQSALPSDQCARWTSWDGPILCLEGASQDDWLALGVH